LKNNSYSKNKFFHIRKKHIASYCLLLVCFASKAQFSLGEESGVSKNHLNTNIVNRLFTENINKGGYSIGIPIQFGLCNWLSFQVVPQMTQKNYSFFRIGSFTGVRESFKNWYLQLPLMAKVSYGYKKIKGFLDLGTYGAYWISGRTYGTQPDIFHITDSLALTGQVETFTLSEYNASYSFNQKKDNRFEFGIVTGIGLTYYVTNRLSIFGEVRYYQAVTDHQKRYMFQQIPEYNQTTIFLLGCFLSFKQNASK